MKVSVYHAAEIGVGCTSFDRIGELILHQSDESSISIMGSTVRTLIVNMESVVAITHEPER